MPAVGHSGSRYNRSAAPSRLTSPYPPRSPSRSGRRSSKTSTSLPKAAKQPEGERPWPVLESIVLFSACPSRGQGLDFARRRSQGHIATFVCFRVSSPVGTLAEIDDGRLRYDARSVPETPDYSDDPVVVWAACEAATRLSPLGDRWLHVKGVVDRARCVAPILAHADAHCLVAAAHLHDIGWAPELVDTGFHPIDGARWVRRHGFERLARLVAHHSAARFEAKLRGMESLLAVFELEESPAADALAYCDLTTSPTGDVVTPVERWTDIVERYGQHDIVVQALARARPLLEAAVARTEQRLRAATVQPM
jgi:hypothetical protein